MQGIAKAIQAAPVEFVKSLGDLLQNPVTTVKGIVAALQQLPELPGAIAAYMESIEEDEEAKGEEIAEFIASNILMLAIPNKVKILTQLGKTKKLGKALRIVASESKQVLKEIKLTNRGIKKIGNLSNYKDKPAKVVLKLRKGNAAAFI